MIDQVLQGDMREVLRALAEGSVDMCVTSPPYHAQRAYAGETEAVWGGDPNCEHVWGEEKAQEGYQGRTRWQHVAGKTEGAVRDASPGSWGKVGSGRFCQRCGAWWGELGREPTVELYIAHIVECMREVWRTLSPYGTLWLNLGGCYANVSGGAVSAPGRTKNVHSPRLRDTTRFSGYKPLDYIPVPHLVAMALQREGWYFRRPIVWHKKGPMPESPNTWRWEQCRVKLSGMKGSNNELMLTEKGHRSGYGEERAKWIDCPGCPKCEPHGGLVLRYGAWRPTTAHEYVFLLSKEPRYYCDQDAVRTPVKQNSLERAQHGWHGIVDDYSDGARTGSSFRRLVETGEPMGVRFAPKAGANARSVQTWPTANLGLDHFAAFSVELAAWCIRAGTSPRGYCPKCSRPWVRVIERGETLQKGAQARKPPESYGRTYPDTQRAGDAQSTTLGWKATCGHGLEPRRGRVLDPFGGAGTVALAAKALWPASRNYILVEISEEYCEMSRHRIRKGFTVNKKQREVAKDVLVEGVGRVTEVRLL